MSRSTFAWLGRSLNLFTRKVLGSKYPATEQPTDKQKMALMTAPLLPRGFGLVIFCILDLTV